LAAIYLQIPYCDSHSISRLSGTRPGNLYVNTLPFGIERQFFQKCRAYSQVISTVVFYVMPSDRLFLLE